MKSSKKKSKKKKNEKIGSRRYLLGLVVFIFVSAAFFSYFHAEGAIADRLIAKGNFYFNGGAYDLGKAAKWYKLAMYADSNSSTAHYQLARVYFVQNKLAEAKSEIDKALSINPDGKRSYYVRGLINGYSGNYQEAVSDFKKFTEMVPDEWAGYNDLAWVYYEMKDYENAREALEKGLTVKPENPWLLNGLGAVYNALGEFGKAEEALSKASSVADNLSIKDWGTAYPGNDASSAGWDLAKFRNDIRYNQDLAYNEKSLGGIMTPACTSSCSGSCSGCDYLECCVDTDHGTDPSCTNYGFSASCCPAVNGDCNPSYNGQDICSIPGSGLCSSGSQNPVPPNGSGPWSWSCDGAFGGSPMPCGATKKVVNALCGGANNGRYCPGYTIPEDAKCTPPGSTGFSSVVNFYFDVSASKWFWSCSSTCNGSSSGPCFATLLPQYKGECGTLNGKTICDGTSPASLSNACATPGSAIILHTPTSPYDEWIWKCPGSCDADSSNCTAKSSGSCGWIETNP
jgi:tetratricopeptide (TPR) repeat protein